MEEIIELADNGAEDLELLKIKIPARQWLVEQLLAPEKPGETVKDFSRLASDEEPAEALSPIEERIMNGNCAIRALTGYAPMF